MCHCRVPCSRRETGLCSTSAELRTSFIAIGETPLITLYGQQSQQFCDGVGRRNFLKIGALGATSLGLHPQLWSAPTGQAAEKSVIMVYLPGGPTQHETFDPKPLAPAEIRGSFGTISTSVPGVHFCELLPRLAGSFERFSVIRSLVGMLNRHESFQCYTGRPGGRPGDNDPGGGWPTFGSTVSKILGPNSRGIVPYVDAAPHMGHAPYNNRGIHDGVGTTSWPGFTGREHTPLTLAGEIKDDLELHGIDLARLRDRQRLLEHVSRSRISLDRELNAFQEQAFGLLTSNVLAEALDLEREDPRVRERYGAGQPTHSSFGGAPQDPERFLLARRLVEVGVKCVTLSFGAWDWHANREGTIEFLANKYLPVFDQTLSIFLEDLDERGLLEHVSVVVLGEFGRTPRINTKGGRDHWPNTQSIVLAGGGIRGGQVLGTTDNIGGTPIKRPVHIQEVFATLYRTLGIDVNTVTISDHQGRPRYLVDNNRQPIPELTT